jgi:uncharacterized protein (DUF433 family)
MELHLTPETEARLNELAQRTRRGTDELLEEAVDHLVTYNDWFERKVKGSIAAIERGETVPDEEVRGWIMRLNRITIDPTVATGKPCIRNLRFPVSRLLGLLAAGETRESIVKAYPYLEPADVDEALRYAAYLSEDETIELSR